VQSTQREEHKGKKFWRKLREENCVMRRKKWKGTNLKNEFGICEHVDGEKKRPAQKGKKLKRESRGKICRVETGEDGPRPNKDVKSKKGYL